MVFILLRARSCLLTLTKLSPPIPHPLAACPVPSHVGKVCVMSRTAVLSAPRMSDHAEATRKGMLVKLSQVPPRANLLYVCHRWETQYQPDCQADVTFTQVRRPRPPVSWPTPPQQCSRAMLGLRCAVGAAMSSAMMPRGGGGRGV